MAKPLRGLHPEDSIVTAGLKTDLKLSSNQIHLLWSVACCQPNSRSINLNSDTTETTIAVTNPETNRKHAQPHLIVSLYLPCSY